MDHKQLEAHAAIIVTEKLWNFYIIGSNQKVARKQFFLQSADHSVSKLVTIGNPFKLIAHHWTSVNLTMHTHTHPHMQDTLGTRLAKQHVQL